MRTATLETRVDTQGEPGAGPFIETACTILHEGKEYTAGGAWLCECTDGRARGVVYVHPPAPHAPGPYTYRSNSTYPAGWGTVTTWHGTVLAKAYFGRAYFGPFCRLQSVRFEYQGRTFSGRYCPDWSQACRVKSGKASR